MILAIDTSGVSTQIALKGLDGKVRQAPISCKSSQHEDLSRAVQELLSESGASAAAIKLVLLGAGPGSFTGLRIGYSFVQGLVYGTNAKIQEVNSLLAIAWCFRDKAQLIAAIRDARREEIFVQFFAASAKEFTALSEPKIIMAKAVSSEANALKSGDWQLVCSVGEETAPELKATACPLNAVEDIANAMIELYENGGLKAGVGEYSASNPLDLSALSPRYIRDVSARKICERQLTNKPI